ncbi:MAG: indole-3-glycerol phosphate synthase TrpC [Thermodesulfobacteriaceae bacterium]|nr:indole-3-glycerol phosphate synthase TrpC [Thermodesulfobacteriaceae bacterium]
MSEKILNPLLDKILIEKYYNVLKRKQKGLFYKPFWNRPSFNFKEYLLQNNFVIIAEVKRASPLKGELNSNFNPLLLAQAYEKGGAKAISVITEENFFMGSIEYLAGVRTQTNLPLLYKDFVLDPIQIEEAKAFGADIVLLISSILKKEDLQELIHYGKKIGVATLVEIHSEEDLEKVLSLEVEVIGINNRNLTTLEVNTSQSLKIFPLIPKEIPVIAESGYSSVKELIEIKKRGFKGVLIGTHLVKSRNPEELLKSWVRELNNET